MLTRLYVDNFRCLVNFEFRPQAKQLVVGLNGTGKSTLLEVLDGLRRFVCGDAKPEVIFLPETRTRWQQLNVQTFEIDAVIDKGTYQYKLSLEHWGSPQRPRVNRETLTFDAKPIFEFVTGEVHLFNDRHEHKVTYPFDWHQSALATITARRENTRLTKFKEWLSELYTIQIDPRRMIAMADQEDRHPSGDLGNFAAWYRHLLQEDTSAVFEVQASLREIISGFDSLDLASAGQNTRVLKANFSTVNADESPPSARQIEFNFDELSHGQRTLIGLYTLLPCVLGKRMTLCIDEPENFIALPEIQPWLFALSDQIDDKGGQVILISHHPEVINQLAPDHCVSFARNGVGPVRVEPFRGSAGSDLPPAEQIARGWDRE